MSISKEQYAEVRKAMSERYAHQTKKLLEGNHVNWEELERLELIQASWALHNVLGNLLLRQQELEAKVAEVLDPKAPRIVLP